MQAFFTKNIEILIINLIYGFLKIKISLCEEEWMKYFYQFKVLITVYRRIFL